MPSTIRPIRDDEVATWFESFSTAFYIWVSDPEAVAASRRPSMDLERTIAAFDGDTMVGTFRTFPTRLTLPGNARVPVAAVTAVSVRPTHRRRGLLSSLIADDVERAAKRDEVASVLLASEWPIYGRFGYGPATMQGGWSLRVRAARFAGEPSGTIEFVKPKRARELVPGIFERCIAAQPGEIGRTETRWDHELGLVELPGRPPWRGWVVVHRDDDGELDGYARYHGTEKWDEGIPDNVLVLDELHGVTPAVELDLWRFLAQLDLTATIVAETRREREPMQWHLADPRAMRLTSLADALWVRIFDVERMLSERAYERDGELVLEVRDEVGGKAGPAAGRYRLVASGGTATCTRTDAAADVTVDVRHLGAASLGGTRLVDAGRAGGLEEHRAFAIRDLDLLLRTADVPWCSTFF